MSVIKVSKDWPQSTEEGPACNVSVEASIDRSPLTVSPQMLLENAVRLMSQGKKDDAKAAISSANTVSLSKRVSYVLVIENSKLVGIITERDIVKLTAKGIALAGVVVADVMTPEPMTLQEDELHDCLRILQVFRSYKIRHLPVLNERSHIVGVVTPESICRSVQPTVLLKLRQIEEVMSREVITAGGSASVTTLAQQMAARRVSCVVITSVKEGFLPEPIGVITERDIVQFQSLALDLNGIRADAVMSAPLTCLQPQDSLWTAYEAMKSLRVRRLVIIDESGGLVGIVTQTSLLSMLNPVDMCTTVDILQQQVETLTHEKVELLRSLNESLRVQVEDSEARFRTTFEQAAAGIVHVDLMGRYVQVNQRFCEMVSYTRQELLGKTVLEITHPNSRKHDGLLIKQLIEGEITSFTQEKQYCRGDGGTVWVSVTASRVNKAKGEADYLIAVVEDISARKKIEAELALHRNHLEELVTARTSELEHEIDERKRVEQQLFAEKELAQVTLHSIGDAVITTNAAGQVSYLNPIAEKLTGWSHSLALHKPLSEVFVIVNEISREPVESPVERVLKDACATGLANHTILVARDGTEYGIDDSAAPLRNHGGEIIGAVMVFRDATRSRQIARQLSWQAGHDALTGLVNRRQFEQVLAEAHEAILPGQQHVLCYLDLDCFKVVNDTCGHTAGDELLRQVSALLSRQVRAADTLARLGGDEFAILLYQCPSERAQLIAEQIREAVDNFRFSWESATFQIGVSVGLVVVNADSQTMMTSLSAADTACYTAKAKGRNRVQLYQPNDAAILQQRGQQQWSMRIKQALEKDQFCLYRQKIVPASGNADNYAEILLRMVDDQGRLILPGAFIPAAERYDLMPQIDRWVVKAFFSYICGGRCDPNLTVRYMLNLSGASVGDEQFLSFLKTQLSCCAVDPNSICFEITETAAIANLNQAIDFIQELKQLGFCFALDDFGSGMCSFTYLKTLPVDYIKIDGKFIADLDDDPTALAIVEAINDVGHVMGLKTIAEFVSSHKVQRILAKIGIDYMQGYGIAMPQALKL